MNNSLFVLLRRAITFLSGGDFTRYLSTLEKLSDFVFRRRFPPVISAVRADSLSYLSAFALNDLYEHILRLETSGVQGIFIEAGCALGGSAIIIASAKSQDRPFFVYDAFGMIPPPSENDGEDVHKRYEVILSGRSRGIDGVRKYYGYEENLLTKVKENFQRYGIRPEENNVYLVKGLFQETLHISQPVAFAHLDGDWYESVMTCLRSIEPYLVPNGVIVVDDYYCWSGCRRAVDEYFQDKRDRYRFVRKSRLHIIREKIDM